VGSNSASYSLFAGIGFILGALLRIWLQTDFDLDALRYTPDVLGTIGFGLGGALVAMVVRWFL